MNAPVNDQGQPPKSNFWRNCFLCVCLVVFLGIAAVVGGGMYVGAVVKALFPVGPAAAPVLATVAGPGAQIPAGTSLEFGINGTIPFSGGLVAKGVFIKVAGTSPDSLIAVGGMSTKTTDKNELKKSIAKAIAAQKGGGQDMQAEADPSTESSEDFTVGSGADAITVSAAKSFVVDKNNGTKMVQYMILLDPFDNEFGWLVVFATGPENGFKTEPLKRLLSTIKPKK